LIHVACNGHIICSAQLPEFTELFNTFELPVGFKHSTEFMTITRNGFKQYLNSVVTKAIWRG